MIDRAASAGVRETPATATGRVGDYSVTVVRTEEDIQQILATWRELQGSDLGTDPSSFHEELELNRENRISPHILVIERHGEPVAMLLAYARDLRFAYKLGYKWLHTPSVRGIVAVCQGVLGDVDDGVADALLAELRRTVEHREADAIHFVRLLVDSPLFSATTRRAPFPFRRVRRPVARWELDLPTTFEDFVRSRSSKTRRSIRYYARMLERDFTGELTVKVFREPDSLGELGRDLQHIADQSWQGDVGIGFRNDESQLRRIARGMDEGAFLAYVLYIRDRPAAFWFGEALGDRFHLTGTAFDPNYPDYRIGTYLLMRVIEDLCENPSIAVLDYGLGDADYKHRYGSRRWEERDVVLFPARPRAVAMALLVTSLEVAQGGLQALLRRPFIKRELKRIWRGMARIRRGHARRRT